MYARSKNASQGRPRSAQLAHQGVWQTSWMNPYASHIDPWRFLTDFIRICVSFYGMDPRKSTWINEKYLRILNGFLRITNGFYMELYRFQARGIPHGYILNQEARNVCLFSHCKWRVIFQISNLVFVYHWYQNLIEYTSDLGEFIKSIFVWYLVIILISLLCNNYVQKLIIDI